MVRARRHVASLAGLGHPVFLGNVGDLQYHFSQERGGFEDPSVHSKQDM
jgi:hypothetical protein